jgi:hypothetical protein
VRVARPEDALAAPRSRPCALPWQQGLAGSAALADLRRDPALAELVAQRLAAVTAVSPDLAGLVAGGAEVVDEREQVRPLVLVPGAEPDADRPAPSVDDEVVFRCW